MSRPAPPVPAAPPDEHAPDAPRPRRPAARTAVPAVALAILGLLLVGFAAEVAVLGRVRHDRDQRVAYAALRKRLAEGTAPVGPRGLDGRPLAPGTPVVVLEIPRLGVREVVLEGTTSGVLQSGPGHRRDTVLPGQAGTAVVLGRRAAYGGPFRRVPALRPGDVVVATTGQGVHRYVVTGVRRAGERFAPPAPGVGRLTLATAGGATYLPAGVVRVDAELRTPVRPAPGNARTAVTAAEQPLAGDRAALVGLVLWGELLLAAALGLVWARARARARWGVWQAWVVAVPVLGALGLTVADHAARLLPNLL